MIETQRLIIREFEYDDAKRMSEYRSKKEVAEYQSWKVYPLFRAKRRITYCKRHPFCEKDGDYQLAIILKETNTLIGDLFIEIETKKHLIDLGYTLDSIYWSKGYASEAVRSFLHYLGNHTSIKEVRCYAYTDNVRSLRLLEALGFQEFTRSPYYGDVGYRKYL